MPLLENWLMEAFVAREAAHLADVAGLVAGTCGVECGVGLRCVRSVVVQWATHSIQCVSEQARITWYWPCRMTARCFITSRHVGEGGLGMAWIGALVQHTCHYCRT